MDDHAERRAFALQVAECIMDSRQFRQLLKEVVLTVLAAQEEARRQGIVRSLLQCCDALGVSFRLDGERVCMRNRERLDEELRALLLMYREEVVAQLRARSAATAETLGARNGKTRAKP